MERLSGKVAFITGGGTGIGRACALAFAAEGARVAVAGRRREPLEAVISEIQGSGAKALALTCDIADRGGGRSCDFERRAALWPAQCYCEQRRSRHGWNR